MLKELFTFVSINNCSILSCFIIDRKKDLVKLHAGEYVALGKVESVLSRCSLVESVCVYAYAGKTYIIALIVPRAKELAALAKSLNLNPNDMEALCENPTVVNKVMEFIETTAKTGKCTRPIAIPRRCLIIVHN